MTVPLQRSPFLTVKQVAVVGLFFEVIKQFHLQTVQVPFHIVALFAVVCCVKLLSAKVGVILTFDRPTFTVSDTKTSSNISF
jgi:hypothetical protein